MREFAPDTLAQLVGQLDKISSPNTGATDPAARDALIESAFLLAAVDGHVSELEAAQFGEAVESALGRVEADPSALMKRFADALAKEGWETRMNAVARALAGTEHAERAYRVAAGVAFVDDTVESREADALDSFAGALGLSAERAHEIMAEVRSELFGD
jgi:tellurite resistance protein